MERLTKQFPVFDCDAHINDPLKIWEYVPESKKELVRNTYWRGDSEAWLNGTQPVMGGGNGHFAPSYNPICIAGPQMNKKIMRRLQSMVPLTDEQRAYVHHDGAIDPHVRHQGDGPHGHRPGARHPDDGHHVPALRREPRGCRRLLPGVQRLSRGLVQGGPGAPVRCSAATRPGSNRHRQGDLPRQGSRPPGRAHQAHRCTGEVSQRDSPGDDAAVVATTTRSSVPSRRPA